jgi:hypothetical protein
VKPHEIEDPKLQELARRLGVRAGDRLDVERTAEAVVARLRRSARQRTWLAWTEVAWVRAAAMVVVLLGAGILLQPSIRPMGAALDDPPLGSVQELSADQLTHVLDEMNQPVDLTAPAPEDAGLEDLSEPQLRTLLQSLEG